MSHFDHQSLTRRPLGEATRRVNNSQGRPKYSFNYSQIHNKSPNPDCAFKSNDYYPPNIIEKGSPNIRVSTFARGDETTNKLQTSSASADSRNSRSRLKTYIGPWKLGKTLGEGSSARVRLARHKDTGQEVAVKIVKKASAHMSQSGSLANFERDLDSQDDDSGLRRMPVAIEREVAIMKLIQHPNILKLYDIWENRKEIYLCLEYVDDGELFKKIYEKGRLEEEEAIGYFRQILSAIQYCHSFNICHRDLKPENILLKKNGEIKIADFGMAALHQAPGHRLSTPCGSPHYAAPELIRGSKYHGSMVDIWSMGVILFASLSGRLPFDIQDTGHDVSKESLNILLAMIKKGEYKMANNFSPEAKNLISRMIQVNPNDRIKLCQIWQHPLLMKYNYLDSLEQQNISISPSAQACCSLILRRSEIDSEIFRHLRSMWHRLSEKKLMEALLSDEWVFFNFNFESLLTNARPNDQKLFYTLLIKFRDTQLENYNPDLKYSASDYHYVKPNGLTKTFSTCQFPHSGKKCHRRRTSKFTVISNAGGSERDLTFLEEDSNNRNHKAKMKVYRYEGNSRGRKRPVNTTSGKKLVRESSQTSTFKKQKTQFLSKPSRVPASRSSLTSFAMSQKSARKIRVSNDKKRGVSFNHFRKNSANSFKYGSIDSPLTQNCGQHSNHTENIDNDSDVLHPVPEFSKTSDKFDSTKGDSTSINGLLRSEASLDCKIFNDDMQQLSTILARDCDVAFNCSEYSILQEPSTHLEITKGTAAKKKPNISDLIDRPLPEPPAMQVESSRIELRQAKKKAELRRHSGGESSAYLDRLVTHIDELIKPLSPNKSTSDRRAISAPVDMRNLSINRQLPSIYENGSESLSSKENSHAIISEENHCQLELPETDSEDLNKSNDWITRSDTPSDECNKIVRPSSPYIPMDIPAPLSIHKIGSQRVRLVTETTRKSHSTRGYLELNEKSQERFRSKASSSISQHNERVQRHRESDDHLLSNSSGTVKRKPIWFRKGSVETNEGKFSEKAPLATEINNTIGPPPERRPCFPLEFKKMAGYNFAKIFKKRSAKLDMTLCNDHDYLDFESTLWDSTTDNKCSSNNEDSINKENGKYRQIVPQRNWFARLFKIKPIVKFICFSISRKKARREVFSLLKSWKHYGIRDVQVDNERNIIFGKVGIENCELRPESLLLFLLTVKTLTLKTSHSSASSCQ